MPRFHLRRLLSRKKFKFGLLISVLYILYVLVTMISAKGKVTDPWILSSEELPSDERFRPTIANGYIGTIVYHKNIHVTGVYNGHANASTYETTSTHCKIPNQIAFRLDIRSNERSEFLLNLYDGVFIETVITADWEIQIRQYAHQIHKTLLVLDILGKPRSPNPVADFKVQLQKLTLNESEIHDMQILDRKSKDGIQLIKYRPLVQEDESVPSPNLTVVSTEVPQELIFSVNGKTSWTFLMAAVVNSNDEVAYEDLDIGLRLSNNGTLYTQHVNAWHQIWDNGGRIDIIGDNDLAQTVHSSMYYLLSSSPIDPYDQATVHGWPNFGLSPASLAHSDERDQHYYGHIFWDQETWMLPALVPFQPEVIRRILIDTRIRRLNQARQKATKMNWKGAMFPWEVGYSGVETTNWEPAASREIHITGDIAQFARQYLYWTNDQNLLWSDGGYTLFQDVAKFWASRLVWMPDQKSYSILDVMGPDEHHDHVNNSVYTNAIASICLRIPKEFYDHHGGEKSGFPLPDPNWIRMANLIRIPFDEQLQFHPEYDGYKAGEIIKQADVVLLGYPLMMNMSRTVRENDLNIYEQNTSPQGPCMTWSIHSIGWLHLSNTQNAYNDFKRNFRNIQGPFKIWTETAQGDGAVNFITGIGGFLQNILYGYLDLRVENDRLDFYPKSIPNTKGYVISKIKYLGQKFTFNVTEQHVNLDTERGREGKQCFLHRYSTGVTVVIEGSMDLPLERYAILCKS